jgi:hypothetical protein
MSESDDFMEPLPLRRKSRRKCSICDDNVSYSVNTFCDACSSEIYCAIQKSDIKTLEKMNKNGQINLKSIIDYAVKLQKIIVVEFLISCGCPMDSTICYSAAMTGDLKMVKLLRDNGCDWDHNICTISAASGYLELLQWVIENGCNWGEHKNGPYNNLKAKTIDQIRFLALNPILTTEDRLNDYDQSKKYLCDVTHIPDILGIITSYC